MGNGLECMFLNGTLLLENLIKIHKNTSPAGNEIEMHRT